jgi:chaperonin GroES
MRELQPLNNNVILDLSEDKKEQKTAAGIIIPDSAKEQPQYAKVVAVGHVENPAIAAGDTVFYKKFAGNEVSFDGKKYLFIPYEDIMAKVVETDEI